MHVKLDYNPYDPLPDLNPSAGLGSKGVKRYLNVEALWMPAPGYFENKSAEVWRERAVIVIFNVAMRENLEPFIPYLAMNYYDRCISRDNPLPVAMKYRQNDLELLSICCLTLACKMRDKDFSIIEFQARHLELVDVTPEKFLMMELYILKGIDWRLRAVTAISFVQFFAPEHSFTYGIRRRTINQIIINSQSDFKKMRFRPSVMAASAFLAASSLLYPEEFQSSVDKIISHEIFKETDLLNCMKGLIRECKELNLLIESAVAENEYLPRKKVQAEGETSEDEDETPTRFDIVETSTREGTPQRLRPRDPMPSHKQVAIEVAQPSAGTRTRMAGEEKEEPDTTSKGKEEASEVKMAEDSEELAMGFVLRWRLGETKADEFAIFTDVANAAKAGQRRGRRRGSNYMAPEAAAGANPPQSGVSKLRMFCEFCCFCSCCHPF